MWITGETRAFTLTSPGAGAKTAFGAVSTPLMLVDAQTVPAPENVVAHPGGSAGTETESKFSENPAAGAPSGRESVTVPMTTPESWRFKGRTNGCPQVPCAVNVKSFATAAPPDKRAP